MNYNYFYISWTLLYLSIWLLLFYWRKDVRREMLFISPLFGIAGLITQAAHIEDWWQPLTILGTPVSIEDFLIGFAIGGVVAVLYEEVYRKRIKVRSKEPLFENKHLLILPIVIVIFLGLFYYFDLSSADSLFIALLISIGIIWIMRRDLIVDSIVSGFLFLILGTFLYALLGMIYPEFIQKFWFLPKVWYSKLFLGLPVGEYIWHFLAGAFIGPLYEFWQEGKLIRLKR